jgi:transposase
MASPKKSFRLSEKTKARVLDLLTKNKFTYVEIAEKCKVSCATVARWNAVRTGKTKKSSTSTTSATK